MGMERLNGVEFVYRAVLPFSPMAVFAVDAKICVAVKSVDFRSVVCYFCAVG